MSEQKHTPGIVSYLPQHSGDGYSWGGDIIVTFGDVSFNLGHDRESLAHLIAAAPTMHDYIARKAAEGDAEAVSILEAINAGR